MRCYRVADSLRPQRLVATGSRSGRFFAVLLGGLAIRRWPIGSTVFVVEERGPG